MCESWEENICLLRRMSCKDNSHPDNSKYREFPLRQLPFNNSFMKRDRVKLRAGENCQRELIILVGDCPGRDCPRGSCLGGSRPLEIVQEEEGKKYIHVETRSHIVSSLCFLISLSLEQGRQTILPLCVDTTLHTSLPLFFA